MSSLETTGTVVIDGQMCEEIRLGIHLRQAYVGRGFRPKKGGITMSFGSTILDIAGGFQKFLEDYEEDPSF